MQTTKDLLRIMNYAVLPGSLKWVDYTAYHLEADIEAKTAELAAAHEDFAQERGALLSRISDLEAHLKGMPMLSLSKSFPN